MFECHENLIGGALSTLLRDESRQRGADRVVLDIAEDILYVLRCNTLDGAVLT